jgi:hypothetical protein
MIAATIALILVLLILWLIPKLFRLFRRYYARLVSFIKGGPAPGAVA